jgi:zinc/manganese transport system substrate-binding protein
MKHYFAAALAILLLVPAAASAKDRLSVVTSFSILADMTAHVGGDHVTVTSLIPANTDAHVFTPAPGDVRTLGAADVFVMNGLGFEGWAEKLVKSANFKGIPAVAAKGAETLKGEEDEEHGHDDGHKHGDAHHHHEFDPHAWQTIENGIVYVANIRDALVKADPAHAADYMANAERYTAELKDLDAWVKAEIGKVPAAKRKVITSHDAFRYFGRAYGVEFLAPAGVNEETEPSAKDVARIIDLIRKQRITALFMENISDKRLIEQLQRDGGATIGGTIYSDALSTADGPANSYTGMFRHNVGQLVPAMLGNPGS